MIYRKKGEGGLRANFLQSKPPGGIGGFYLNAVIAYIASWLMHIGDTMKSEKIPNGSKDMAAIPGLERANVV